VLWRVNGLGVCYIRSKTRAVRQGGSRGDKRGFGLGGGGGSWGRRERGVRGGRRIKLGVWVVWGVTGKKKNVRGG